MRALKNENAKQQQHTTLPIGKGGGGGENTSPGSQRIESRDLLVCVIVMRGLRGDILDLAP